MAAIRCAAIFAAATLSVSLAACGGGGGSSALPPVAAGSPAVAGSSSVQAVSFTIAIPGATAAASTSRRPAYVSAGTKSATVTVAGTSQTTNCATSCSLTLTVPTGTQTFTATLYSGSNGGGSALATGTATTTIAAGAANVVQIVFGGIPVKLSIALASSSVPAGTSASIPVTVAAQDAAGYTIVGSDPYATPIALADDDASGATHLSTTSVTSPGATVTLSYDGSASLAAAHVSASLPGLASQTATLTVAQPAAAAAPAAVDHVKNFAYYGLNDMDADIPASYMAAHVDMVDDDGISAQHADAFKKAGGKIALAYTDPTFVPYCPAPFTAPAGLCTGPIGKLVASDETAWLHDASGARINRYNDPHFLYQEILNVGSASAQKAYAQTTGSVLAQSPLLDGFEADDSGSPLASLYGGFSASASVEITSDAAWMTGEGAMLAAAGKPVIVNGGDPVTWGPSYNGAFVDLAAVMGQMFEGCFNNGDSGPYTDSQSRFQREANGLLAVQAHRKLALCMPTGKTDPASRLYAYASFLLAYDPTYSVFGMNQKQSDGESLYPETQFVPQQPRVTATDVSQLKNGGVYVREFAACTIAGTSVGPCAAVVNSSPSASASVPGLAIAYAHQVALDAASLYGGGKANVVAGTPSSLGPVSGAILVR